MTSMNKFYINKLSSVVFLGHTDVFNELLKINNNLKLKTIIITSKDQSKKIENKNFKYFIYDKMDNKFKNFILKQVNIESTLFISLGARQIFSKDLINNFFKNNLINFHETRLPLDSGGGDISWNIMREDRISNMLCHLIDESIDAGPIIYHKKSLIPKNRVIPKDMFEYKMIKFLEFYEEFIKKLLKKEKFDLMHQVDYLGRYNPRLNTEIDGLIDWSLNSYELINFINAFDEPYIGASSYLNSGNHGKLYIKDCQLHGGDSSNHSFMSGIVSRHDKDWIVVSTSGKHMLLIQKVINKSGKNILDKIKVGDRFYSPSKELEISKKNRNIYNASGLKK